MSCGAGDACGFAAGELVGVGISGVCRCGLADCFGVVVLLIGVRLARGAGFLLGLARFGLGFGFAFGAGFGITWPSCCGNTLMLSAKVNASAPIIRNAILKLLHRFMFSPK